MYAMCVLLNVSEMYLLHVWCAIIDVWHVRYAQRIPYMYCLCDARYIVTANDDMPNDTDMYIMRVWCAKIYVCNVRTAQCFWYVFIACAMHDNWCMTCVICSTILLYMGLCKLNSNLCHRGDWGLLLPPRRKHQHLCSTIFVWANGKKSTNYCSHHRRRNTRHP